MALHENFANAQADKDEEATSCDIQPETGIQTPHEHDVLIGSGYCVRNQPGNIYYLNLVREHLSQFINNSQNEDEERKCAQLIIDKVRMRCPPGRFLRKNSDTKMWSVLGHQKTLDKTMLVLRVSASRIISSENISPGQERCENSSGRKWGPPPDTHNFSSISISQKSSHDGNDIKITSHVEVPTPLHQTLLLTNQSVRIPGKLAPSIDMTNSQAHRNLPGGNIPIDTNVRNNIETKKVNDAEKLAQTVASRLVSSNGTSNENVENLVALGILAVIDGGYDTIGGHETLEEPTYEYSTVSNPNTGKKTTSTEPLTKPKRSEIPTVASKISKRSFFSRQVSDISLMSNKRKKTAMPRTPPSNSNGSFISIEESIGISRGDEKRMKESCSDGNSSVLLPECIRLPCSNQKQYLNDNGIWSTPSLGAFMQCDTCLGTGILPLPSSGTSTLHNTPRNLLPDPLSSILRPTDSSTNLPLPTEFKSSGKSQLKTPLTGNDKIPEVQRKDVPIHNNRSCSIWSDKIRTLENKWNIEVDDSRSFPQRVETIKNKARRNDAKNLSESSERTREEKSTIQADGILKEVERAEEKWGLPEGCNLSDRIQAIEQTAHSFIKRLKLWL